jgi:hypothetical protein
MRMSASLICNSPSRSLGLGSVRMMSACLPRSAGMRCDYSMRSLPNGETPEAVVAEQAARGPRYHGRARERCSLLRPNPLYNLRQCGEAMAIYASRKPWVPPTGGSSGRLAPRAERGGSQPQGGAADGWRHQSVSRILRLKERCKHGNGSQGCPRATAISRQ